MEKQSIITFKDTTKTGIEKIPNEQFLYIESLQRFFIKDNNIGMIAGKTIQDAITAGCLVENGKRVCYPFGSAIFYGGYNGSSLLNGSIIITKNATLSTQTTVGTARQGPAGANVGSNALFYAGQSSNGDSNILSIINSTGNLINVETNIGTARQGTMGAPFSTILALFYAGGTSVPSANKNTLTFINNIGTLVNTEGTIGTGRKTGAGANVGLNCLFYAGSSALNGDQYNIVTIITSSGTLAQAESNIGTARNTIGGASISTSNAIFVGGMITSPTTLLTNVGTLVQAEVVIGTPRYGIAGANVGANAMFYGGGPAVNFTKVTLITPSLTLFQAESNVGTGGSYTSGGASL